MPSSRLSLRLGQLPHDVLAELAARLCSESPALQAAAEECMAAHGPLPLDMVEHVLLSPDLLPSILGPLETEDGAAAAVCSQWLAGWTATNEPRRRLKQVAFNFPEELCNAEMQITSTPDGRLVVGTCSTAGVLYILDRSMRVLQRVPGHWDGGIAANDDSLFACLLDDAAVCRYPHDGAAATEYRLDGYTFWAPALAPGGLLFCVMSDQTDDYFSRTEIIALDAQTLQLRHRFGLGLLNDAHQLAVVVDELYVCDTGNHRLQVFSLTGEHLRSVTGEWRSPSHLCFEKDRLYLIEDGWPPREDPTNWRMGEPGFWGGWHNRVGSSCCRCRATSCRSSRPQESPRPCSTPWDSRFAVSTASCWRATIPPGVRGPGGRSPVTGCSRYKACSVPVIRDYYTYRTRYTLTLVSPNTVCT